MSSHRRVQLTNGKIWGVGAYLLSKEDVIIPVDQLAGMDIEEIGAYVLALVPHATKQRNDEDESERMALGKLKEKSKAKRKKPGFIYLALADTGHYKIGRSKGPQNRIKAMDTKMPIGIDMVYSFPADDYITAEKILHDKFEDKRHNGEWFNLEKTDIELIMLVERFEDEGFYYHHEA